MSTSPEIEPRPYRFQISLRFTHPHEELSACTVEFGLLPSRQWTAGQQRSAPGGKLLEGVWRDSYWTTRLEILPDEDLQESMVRIAQWLAPHAEFFVRHRASGGSANLFIGCFLERFNAGFSLEPSLLAQLAALGVALDFDLYGPDNPPHVA